MTPYGSRYVAPEGAVAVAKANVLEAIRRYGSLTASLRVDPDYLIIGAKRGGTTSLARYLLLHPDVRPLFPARETRKGTYFFDVNYGRGHDWYRSHFPTRMAHGLRERRAGHPLAIGEATPYYLHHPHAPVRARGMVPNAKIIVLLRDPVERAYSHWVERTRNRVETLSFADAIEVEARRLDGEEARMLADPAHQSFAHQHYSYVDQGRYARGLRRWMNAYPANQLLVLRSEDFYADPASVYAEVLEFLGLASFMPDEFRAWNMKPKDAIDPAVVDRVRSMLADDIVELEQLLGRSMRWS
ncbi:MAG: sulfotransferase [Acidimicrobiales bacterium]